MQQNLALTFFDKPLEVFKPPTSSSIKYNAISKKFSH